MQEEQQFEIKAIIGLGNPGSKYALNRHNIGFLIVNALGDRCNADWEQKPHMELAPVCIKSKKVLLIKPQTYMNDSGKVIPFLQKKGIKPENILVIHDELELPFGSIKIKKGGSARGHNGLRSIIAYGGKEFVRLRFGIGRPSSKQEVPTYVLSNFLKTDLELEAAIDQSIEKIENLF